MFNILVVDDEPAMCKMLHKFLKKKGYLVDISSSAEEAINLLTNKYYNLIISDLKLPGIDGVELVKRTRDMGINSDFIIMTAHGTIETAIRSMKLGAFDYIVKPFENAKLLDLINQVQEKQILLAEFARETLFDKKGFDEIIGCSEAIKKVIVLAKKVAAKSATVLLLGESGTGKGVLARAIHKNSPRANKPFLEVNCGVLKDTLLESELFGHKRGSFTGAYKDKLGKFSLAKDGTIFLDEIGELSPLTQTKLLRVLQDGEFEPVGGIATLKSTARIIAATNRDLEKEMAQGKFREDLYYRLNVINITLPPLRERIDDIPLLVKHFIKIYAERPLKINKDAMELLLNYLWPGNIRELENVIERATILCEGDVITRNDLPDKLIKLDSKKVNIPFSQDGSETKSGQSSLTLHESEKQMIIEALKKCKFNKTKAAQMLGITRRALYTRLKRYNIDTEKLSIYNSTLQ